jgi:hypothetical protein
MHTHTAYVPSGKPASNSSSRITFRCWCDSNAATKLNDDPLMALRRWPMRLILYSSTCQHTLVREGSCRRREATHRHMHAHVERSSETNPSTPHPRELVRAEGKRRGDLG